MYLDSAILVKLIVREADTAFYADLVDGQCDIWTSELANRMIEQCRRQHPIRTLDAIHLASCEFRAAFPLQTTDRVMRSAADMLRIGLGPLPS